MGTYYLDIETTGLEPGSSKIITIQYQQLDRNSGMPKGPLVILREWELGEAEIIKRFIENTPAASGSDFDFVPVGYNLKFEHKFLRHRAERYGLPAIDILGKPMLDLHMTGVIMNGCEFAGSGLDRMTGKSQSGSSIGTWYGQKDYDRIVRYVEDEAREFSKFFVWLCRELPILHKRFMASIV